MWNRIGPSYASRSVAGGERGRERVLYNNGRGSYRNKDMLTLSILGNV